MAQVVDDIKRDFHWQPEPEKICTHRWHTSCQTARVVVIMKSCSRTGVIHDTQVSLTPRLKNLCQDRAELEQNG